MTGSFAGEASDKVCDDDSDHTPDRLTTADWWQRELLLHKPVPSLSHCCLLSTLYPSLQLHSLSCFYLELIQHMLAAHFTGSKLLFAM